VVEDEEVTEYVRELDDTELVAFAGEVQNRQTSLLNQGVNLPVPSIETHHLLGLLEAMAGPEVSGRVREWHLMWLDRMFDEVEAAMRVQILGMLDGQP
jgi:hypothetical protein